MPDPHPEQWAAVELSVRRCSLARRCREPQSGELGLALMPGRDRHTGGMVSLGRSRVRWT